MATLKMIDTTKPLELSAQSVGRVNDPRMEKLAREQSMPQLLNVWSRTDGTEPLFLAESADFIAWLHSTPWGHRVEADLQCMSNDAEGRPLLTGWVSFAEFGRLVADARDSIFGERLRRAHDAWAALEPHQVLFDGHMLSDDKGERSYLPPSGGIETPVRVEQWVKDAAARLTAGDAAPFTARVWPYRYGSHSMISCDIDGANRTGESLTFKLGASHDFHDFEPTVPDAAEALHMIGLLTKRVGAVVVLGR